VTPPSETDDRALVARFLRARDEASFRALYGRHTPALYALALRLLAHRGYDAEDAVHDAWIRAVGALERFRWEASFRTWLSGIVVNCCRERLRTDWRQIREADAVLDSRVDGGSPLELTVDVDRAIEQLPGGCRLVFVLHDIDAGTSKSQLFHARRRLRLLLQ
jgi:RNA polymerase sigma factor (sigma-70 family)